MDKAFYGASNFNITATDVPTFGPLNLNLAQTFEGATSLNADLSGWNTSLMLSFQNTFSGATLFNGDVSTWDVSNATNFA